MGFFHLATGLPTGRFGHWRFALIASGVLWSSFAIAAPTESLATAVRAAWAAHPAAQATEQTLAAARARADASARPLYNPEIEFAVDDQGDERTTTAGLALTLDLSGKRGARTAAGEAERAVVEAEAQARRSSFARTWLHAWADRLAAQRRLELGAQRVGLVQRFAELADRQLAVGDISTLERDLALLARDETRAEQATLLADAASADEALRAVGGHAPPPQAAMASEVPPPLSDGPDRLDTVPEQRVALAQSMRASRLVTVAERDRRPDPTLSLRGGQVDIGNVSDNVVGLSISVPLFVRNGYRAEAAAAQADSAAASAEQQRIVLESEAAAERARVTYVAVRDAWSQWSTSAGTDVDARAVLLEKLWRAGELSTADYLIQLQQTVDTALAGADLQGRVWRAFVDALYATGRLDAWIGFDSLNSEVSR